MDRITLKAYAKINLGLDVTGRLPNGYHTVKMIMQTLGICDEVTLEKTVKGIHITTDSAELPNNEDNLMWKAAALMQQTYRIPGGVLIHLVKNIPIAAGMAGGSTDAAAVMRGMNLLYDLNIPKEELMTLAVSIGADVPYCILGGTALAEGIGEELTSLPPMPACYLLVAKPDINVSTKYVYEHLDKAQALQHPDIDGIVSSIMNQDINGVLSRLGNVLETVTVPAYPVINTLKEEMLRLGAEGTLMSGSGPTVFGIFRDLPSAESAYIQLKQEKLAKQIFVTTPVQTI